MNIVKSVALVSFLSSIMFQASAATQKLTLYTSQPPVDAQVLVDNFKQNYPDVDVEWIRDGTTQLMTRLDAEIKAGVTKPDVLLIADSMTMESLKNRNLLYRYKSPELKNYDQELYDKDGYFAGTKLITTGIAYHSQASFKPTKWQDLTNPQIKGQGTMPSPLYSGAAMIQLATLVDSTDLGWNYYEALRNNGVTAQGGNGGVLTSITNGTKPYGVLVDYMAIRAKAKGSPIEFVFPKDGSTVVTEPVAIMSESKNIELAKKFVNFVLSQQGQEVVLNLGYIPAAKDMPMPKGFPQRSEIKILPLNISKALADESSNKQRFQQLFVGQ